MPKKRTSLSKGLIVLSSALVILVVTVYATRSTKTSVDTSKQIIHITATDSTDTFSFSYPDTWGIEPYVWDPCCGTPLPAEPDWTKTQKPLALHPRDNQEASVTISRQLYGDYWLSYEDVVSRVKEDYFATILFEGMVDDTHKGLFARVDYLGPPDAKVESFTDHRYYYDLGDSVLSVEFREKYHHDWYPEQELDYSAYLSDFDAIVNSIRFK